MTMTLRELAKRLQINDRIKFIFTAKTYEMTIKRLNEHWIEGDYICDGVPQGYGCFSISDQTIELLEGLEIDPELVAAIHKFTHLE